MNHLSSGKIIKENSNEEKNIFWSNGEVNYENRCHRLRQKGIVIWFTGMSGAGKSTIASALEKVLFVKEKIVYRLDGDNLRFGLNSDLSFTKEDRLENVRRIAEVAALFKDAGLIVLVACISPNAEMRDFARRRSSGNFIEVYVKASLDTCIIRDTKGLYKKAKNGEVNNFTGISSSYEEPKDPDIVLDTELLTVEECVNTVLDLLKIEL